MALYDVAHDRRSEFSSQQRTDAWNDAAMPLIFAASVLAALMALFLVFGDHTQVGDTSARPSIGTAASGVTLSSPAAPSPHPAMAP